MLLKAEIFWLVCVLFRFLLFCVNCSFGLFFPRMVHYFLVSKASLGIFSLSSREGLKFESIPLYSVCMCIVSFI